MWQYSTEDKSATVVQRMIAPSDVAGMLSACIPDVLVVTLVAAATGLLDLVEGSTRTPGWSLRCTTVFIAPWSVPFAPTLH